MKFNEWLENRELLSKIEKKLDILEEQMGPGAMPGMLSKVKDAGKTVMDDLRRMFQTIKTSSGMKGVLNSVMQKYNKLIGQARTPGEIAGLAQQKLDVTSKLAATQATTQSSGGL